MLECLPQMKGAKFPDEAVMRFFFKEHLDKTPGSVVEFGCGAANNLLMLFAAYGYDVFGVDRSIEALSKAYDNATVAGADMDKIGFLKSDIAKPIASQCGVIGPMDVIMFPGIIYYLQRDDVPPMLSQVNEGCGKLGSWIFVRARGMGDYRLNQGNRVNKNTSALTTNEAGEAGCLNVCYHEWELVDMFRSAFDLDMDTLRVMHIHFENRMMFTDPAGVQMLNHDIVLYGRKKV